MKNMTSYTVYLQYYLMTISLMKVYLMFISGQLQPQGRRLPVPRHRQVSTSTSPVLGLVLVLGQFTNYNGCFYLYSRLEPKTRDEDPALAKKPDPGGCTSNEGRSLKIF